MSHHVVRPSLRRVAAVAALAVVAAGAPALAADAPPVNGAAGIGDPYYADYGNGGYDVSHYGIDVAYTPSAKKSVADQVRGTTTIQATATQSLKRFDLDLVLTATKVEVDGVAATFAQPTNHELVVTPAKPIAEGAEFTVKVTYSGRPSLRTAHGISPWIRTDDGGAAAVGEPEIAGWWYPSNDHPRDKATFDIAVTVPTGMEVLSNGVLVSEDADSAPDTATWQWRETDPMATYLAFFAAGQYTISQSTHDGLPVITAVADDGGDEGTAAAADLARVPEIIDWEASKFGPYPFKALGGVAPAASFGFALENQTRPVYSRLFWQDGVSNIGVVVHEQAHQWFGDSVSVKNWKHIWLNEGFATFTEWLWDEDHDGPTAAEYFKAYYAIPRSDPFWKTRIGDPGAGKEFGDAVYVRGGMALQALRTRVGEATFLDILQTWAASKKGGNGSIAEFRALAEAKSGLDLDSFFTYWLYTGSRPNPIRSNGFPADFGKQKAASPRDVATFDERQELLRKSGD